MGEEAWAETVTQELRHRVVRLLTGLPTVLIHVCVWAGAASHTGMGVEREVVDGWLVGWLGPTLSGVTHEPPPPFLI